MIGSPTRDLFDYTLERVLFVGLVLLVVVVAIWVWRRGGAGADWCVTPVTFSERT